MFALFAGTYYYPFGGWGDFRSAHFTQEEAEAKGVAIMEPYEVDWWQVVNLETLEQVASAQRYY